MRQEKADDGPRLTPRMEAACRQMKEIFDALTVLQARRPPRTPTHLSTWFCALLSSLNMCFVCCAL
jgi:hypothetical protein